MFARKNIKYYQLRVFGQTEIYLNLTLSFDKIVIPKTLIWLKP